MMPPMMMIPPRTDIDLPPETRQVDENDADDDDSNDDDDATSQSDENRDGQYWHLFGCQEDYYDYHTFPFTLSHFQGGGGLPSRLFRPASRPPGSLSSPRGHSQPKHPLLQVSKTLTGD